MDRLQCEKCCYFVDLKLGCIIIGCVSLIQYLSTIPLVLVGYFLLADTLRIRRSTGQTINMVMSLLVAIAGIPISFLLLVGLNKEIPRLVKYYLIFVVVATVFGIFSSFALFIGPINVSSILENMFWTLFGIYGILIVRSYYLKMSANESDEETSN